MCSVKIYVQIRVCTISEWKDAMAQPHKATLRVVQVLNYVRTHCDNGATLAEIARAFNIPKSSLLPIIHTLRDEHFLSYDSVAQRYRIGIGAYGVGQGYIRSSSILSDIQTEMNHIVQATGETCYFGELNGGDIVYLLSVESPQPIRMVATVGNSLPAYSAAIGKALLAGRNIEELKTLYPDGLKKVTPNTIDDFNVLDNQLKEISETGVAYEKEESTVGVQCVAVPLICDSQTKAAISVATPSFRMTDRKRAFITGLLKEKQPKLQNILAAAA
ncbi:IclR family transcriptional regulator [Bifidobacterium sp. ESL0732]|uniref:IclR family transcriptional regulator n=1 Tax=Bifidobacterium sp. ESL0732 TaxID=2983222 RepID=UPI0023F7B476|nr:IclR family transcriptional regulator [Bifidobacterium sp. ESL0732]WEV63909.1 IclR family transcriptional regulator [Bifidobacterium sp. ESL0732]